MICNDKNKAKTSKHKELIKLQEAGVTGGYQRTKIDGSNMSLGWPSSCAAGDLVIPSISTSQNGAQRRDLQARRGWDSKSTWHSIAQTYWLRAEVELLCYHSLECSQVAFSSELGCVQRAPMPLLGCGDASKERSMTFSMPAHVPGEQLSSCIGV